LELESELDRTWTANLIERAETSIGAAGAQTARQRFRGVAKEGVGQSVVGIAEVWVVEEIEELGSETKPHLLGEVKLALQPKIQLRSSETAQHIAPEIALLPGGRRSKGRAIENLTAGILFSLDLQRHS
jgi:hypothetical protein